MKYKILFKHLYYSGVICIKNKLKYGYLAPVYYERLWVSPNDIQLRLPRAKRFKIFGKSRVISGSIIPGEWYKDAEKFSYHHVLEKRFIENYPWSELGVYTRMMDRINEIGSSDGCQNIEEVKERYKKIDELYYQIKREKRFRTREELSGKKRNFAKGRGELRVFVGKYGKLIHGSGGNHRLAIAKILELKKIPVTIGGVHPDGIKYLNKHRSK